MTLNGSIQARKPARRGGWLLLEAVFVVGMVSTLMVAMGVAVTAGVRLYRNLTMDHQARQAVQFLSDQWRRDVRSAASAEIGEATNTLRLPTADGTIEYVPEATGIARQRMQGDDVVTREWIALPAGYEVNWSSGGGGDCRQVELALALPWSVDHRRPGTRTMTLIARLAADRPEAAAEEHRE